MEPATQLAEPTPENPGSHRWDVVNGDHCVWCMLMRKCADEHPVCQGIPESECPNCQTYQPDGDGFGVLLCEACGWCQHPSISDVVCDLCGRDVEVRPLKIYLASSWRNPRQPEIVRLLRGLGHEVYDFRNPGPDDKGFGWSEIDPEWRDWTPEKFRRILAHPIAKRGFGNDFRAMQWADTFVLLLPCGRSAHLEAGWAIGAGKRTLILVEPGEPELMYKLAGEICTSVAELTDRLRLKPEDVTR